MMHGRYDPPKTCPVSCRKCGEGMIEESRHLHKVSFNEGGAGVELEYRRVTVCPQRQRNPLKFWHDRRTFNNDCTIEYPNNTTV